MLKRENSFDNRVEGILLCRQKLQKCPFFCVFLQYEKDCACFIFVAEYIGGSVVAIVFNVKFCASQQERIYLFAQLWLFLLSVAEYPVFARLAVL
ncbi:MAG: hypothetical protein KBT45_05320 [Bacteroidales bacterium]|nr:hypothetical protein [Candidatus Colimorpha pelethequi]